MPQHRHLRRRALAALAATAALGATTAALAADGGSTAKSSGRAATASAAAYARDDGNGHRRGFVSVAGDGSDSGAGTSARSSTRGGNASASASARVNGVSIFGGLVTARSASVSASDSGAASSTGGRVTRLAIDGSRRGTVTSRRVYDLSGYGKLVVLGASGRGILALRAKLSRDYRSYPAGSTVRVAYAGASARDAPAPAPAPKPHKPKPKKPPGAHHAPSHAAPKRNGKAKPGKPAAKPPGKAKRRKAPRTRTLATTEGFVFPVYGKHTFSDDWGAPRADTGFHEGNDIFAAAGTPAVAVCDGSLNRVGTLPISGNRLWVKCAKGGDSFFYAHLSAFASDTHSGAKVTSGQVVGFVGSTGDAEQTPPHLHFEVHPGDGKAVDPYPFLRAWEHRRDVPAAAWVRQNGTTGEQQPGTLVVVRDFLDR